MISRAISVFQFISFIDRNVVLLCQQALRWEKWDAPWRESLLWKKTAQKWGWKLHWWQQPELQACQSQRPWRWWMRVWAPKELGFHLGSATTFLVGSFWVSWSYLGSLYCLHFWSWRGWRLWFVPINAYIVVEIVVLRPLLLF